MIGWLTWRLGALIVSGLLAAAVGVGLVDGIANRATIAELRRGNEKLAGWLGDSQKNVGVCTANVATLDASVKAQGADIRDLAAETKATGKRLEAAARASALEAKAAREAAERDLARPLPLPDLACLEAARLLQSGGF